MNHFIHSKGRTAILTALVFSLSGLLVLPAGAEDLSYVADSGKDGVNVVTRSRAEITRRERSTPRLWWKYGKNTAISSDADIGRVQTVKSKPVEVRRDLSQSNHGSGRVVTAYPTGSQSSSMVLLEKIAPKQVALNEPYDYVMKVTNLTNNHLTDVAVKDQFPSSFTAQSIEPEANETRNGLHTWFLGNLGPKEERLIKIRGVAESAGKHTHCATVTYVCPNCIDVEVVEPKLRLAQSAPSDVLLCDIIPIKYTVTNPGTGATRNATVTASLPTGLKTKDGKT
ncbi:MAG: hypothetical protein QF886_12165, partial [Planctomycetota bacterium]|nr:hypothetical protein [Planctomycetota bacterium]